MIAPSGEQIEIAAGDQQAVVVEVGGGLRSYAAGGRELIDGYGADEMSSSGRGQVLIPWPNRLQDGSYEFDGRRHRLPLNEPEHHNAIHGLVRWAAWTASTREPHRVVMEHILFPQPGYPFSLRLSIEYALSDRGLRVRTTATNLGTDPCPYGSGAHPYLTVGTARWLYLALPILLAIAFQVVARADDAGIGIASFAAAGLACSAFLPFSISFAGAEFPRQAAMMSGALIAFYQIGYGIAAFGVGPLRQLAGLDFASLFSAGSLVALALAIAVGQLVRHHPHATSHAKSPTL